MTPAVSEAVEARVAALRAHARAVEAWQGAGPGERGCALEELKFAMHNDTRTLVALNDALALAAREP